MLDSEVGAVEKLYIYSRGQPDSDLDSPFVVGKCERKEDVVGRETERERESRDIYNNSHVKVNMSRTSYDMGCEGLRPYRAKEFRNFHRKRRGSYRTHAVSDRITEFLVEFEQLYPIGELVPKRELVYWIQRLSLAEDRVTINQYLKRFLLHGYFTSFNGAFKFISKNPKQPTLSEVMNVKRQLMSIRAATTRQKRRRSF